MITRRWWPPFLLGGYAAATALWPYAAVVPLTFGAAGWLFLAPHRWLLAFLCAAILLPPLPIELGDSGPHLSILIAAAGGLIGLSQLGQWRMRPGRPAVAIAAFWCVMMVSLCAAAFYSGLVIAVSSLARALLFGISVYIYWYLTAGPAVDIDSFRWARILFAVGSAAAAVACVDFYYQLPPVAGFAPQYVWLDSGVFRRAQGLFYEASTLGNFCVFFLVMIAVALVKASPVPRWWLACGGCLFAAALLFSYSRGSVVNLAVALVALAVLRGRAGLPVRAVLVLGGAGAGLYWLRPDFVELYFGRLLRSFLFFSDSPETILSGRVYGWESLLRFVADQPRHLLFGIGYKTLPYTPFMGEPRVADNAYLSALIEMGVAGLAALIALNAAILRAAWRAAHAVDARAAFFGTWIFCFWAGESVQMLSGDLLTYWRVLPLYFWALAMAETSDRR
jgi:hypothetical protein